MKINLFSALGVKLYHLSQFARFCFSERGEEIKEARKLTKLGIAAIKIFPQSTREDLMTEYLEPFIAHVLGIYYRAISHHDSIQSHALSGHGLNTMILLRSQLETILTFLYITQPQTDLDEVYKRTDKYRDWVVIKMKQNMEQSHKFDFAQKISRSDFTDNINNNFKIVKDKYINLPKEFSRLEKSSNFLSREQRETLAKQFAIEGLYHHIYAESSASIHFADISDCMEEIDSFNYSYTIRHKNGAFWPIFISNILQFYLIRQFSVFFGIDSILLPRLKAIFLSKDKLKK